MLLSVVGVAFFCSAGSQDLALPASAGIQPVALLRDSHVAVLVSHWFAMGFWGKVHGKQTATGYPGDCVCSYLAMNFKSQNHVKSGWWTWNPHQTLMSTKGSLIKIHAHFGSCQQSAIDVGCLHDDLWLEVLLLACLLARSLACVLACLPASLPACLLAYLLACVLVCICSWWEGLDHRKGFSDGLDTRHLDVSSGNPICFDSKNKFDNGKAVYLPKWPSGYVSRYR